MGNRGHNAGGFAYMATGVCKMCGRKQKFGYRRIREGDTNCADVDACRKRQERQGETSDDLEFRRGYYTAVARIVTMFDEPTVAAEVLREYGGRIDLRGIDEYDARVIRKLMKTESILSGVR